MTTFQQQPVVFHWSTDANGALTHFSNAWFDYTGLDARESYGTRDGWLSVVHPLDRERVQSIWTQHAYVLDRYELDLRIRGRDGLYHRFNGMATPVRENDAIVSWAGYCMSAVEEPQEHRTLRSA